MSFVRLRLENFRRFPSAEFQFSESGITLISGSNGSGKSTVLEAVYLLCIGKTPRDIRFSSLLHRNAQAPFFRVQMERSAGEPRTRSVSFLLGSPVTYHEGEKSVRRSDLIGRPPIVLFSADEMRFVIGEPAMRRKWMDRILSQEQSEYLLRIKRYARTLEERNALLRWADSKPPDAGELLALDETLAEDGERLMESRQKFIRDVGTLLPSKLESLGSPHLAGRIRLELLESAPAGNLLGSLMDHRNRDASVGHTTVGPHRDDIRILDRVESPRGSILPAADTLSQGEIRILSLALKCIESDRLAKSAPPILLFDDLFSELDDTRQASVSTFLQQYPGQALLTSCLPLPPDLLTCVRQKIVM